MMLKNRAESGYPDSDQAGIELEEILPIPVPAGKNRAEPGGPMADPCFEIRHAIFSFFEKI